MKQKIVNGTLLTPFRTIPNGTLVIENGQIIGVHERPIDVPDAVEIDAKGQFVAPGFIDIHVHGGGGFDFMDGTEEAFLKIAELHAQYGTTALVPTTLTAEKEDLLQTLAVYETAHRHNTKGAAFLGMHLEGPYFALSQRGAQDPRYIRNPDPAEYEDILNRSSSIVRWSAAPELEGAIAFGQRLRQKGILAAIAHTDALYEDVLTAYENGYSLVTHLYSAMSGVTRRNAFRYAGVIESAFLLDLDVEIIGDGIHLPPPLLKLVYKIKGADRTALITDAMRAAGMPEGKSILGSLKNGLDVIVEDGVAKLPDRTAFAGSVATMNRLVRNMVQLADAPLLEAVRMASTTPARIMGVDHQKGSLAKGKDADLVFFDQNIIVGMTMIQGKIIHSS
ncbi:MULTISPECIES: N-acetylglucosamine-6-phosphate deacetylase [unclassified Spirosoma]|uniref:N-acetylglucosamine-6-phosphate deacetylase n=1 Tax=unclassified Spirosoma TaxID=2621999 RepID=UPI0009660A34|nr:MULTISPECIES: N-acetylglucosamine-6-phosphate deacetylase [unclassified Spirosoma]MBN8824291.1 N-acetylglucosamine-6-phosphate deacetylase [Spirosoma sp.]OJW70235.1 MAG: N-acetylglucosamine-6-phosphate deacetylase [Spirosoma sp. 48-14]